MGKALTHVLDTWRASGPEVLARVGFSLGWDYLFMAIYSATFVLGGLRVRNDRWPRPSLYRTVATFVIALMVAGTLLDALENALQLRLVTVGPDQAQIAILHWVTSVKWLFVSPCMVFTAIGAGFAMRDRSLFRHGGTR